MNRLSAVAVAVAVAFAFAIVPRAGAPAYATPPPIIGGTADAGDPAVVQILAYPANKSTLYTCTGTVISPTTILTAAHCVDHVASYVYGVYFGADASSFNGQIRNYEPFLAAVSAVHMHPAYSRSSPFTADIAVVTLAQPTTVTPLAFNRDAPTPALVGAPVRIIGYGETESASVHNKKLEATTTIAGLDGGADTIFVGDDQHHTCVGDSGGPVLQGSVILGVDSYAASGCEHAAHFRRTDTYAAFIDSYAGTHPDDTGSGSGSGSGEETDDGMPEPDDDGVPGDVETGDGDHDDDGGGCAVGHPGAGPGVSVLAGLAIVAGALARRRRGRTPRRV